MVSAKWIPAAASLFFATTTVLSASPAWADPPVEPEAPADTGEDAAQDPAVPGADEAFAAEDVADVIVHDEHLQPVQPLRTLI